jgi:hypothetical protein
MPSTPEAVGFGPVLALEEARHMTGLWVESKRSVKALRVRAEESHAKIAIQCN